MPAMLQRQHIPNLLTMLRLLLAAVFFTLLASYQFGADQAWLLIPAMALFIAAALTDMLDGILARRWQVESKFGRIMDPFCDKVLILGAFVRGEVLGRRIDDAVAVAPEWLHDADVLWIMDEEDRLAMREVTVAHRGRERVLITDGVSAGERIVTSDIATPVEGMPLRAAGEQGQGG